jgi:hypothetical protein
MEKSKKIKLVKPVEPDIGDTAKYPRKSDNFQNWSLETQEAFGRDYRRYMRDLEAYESALAKQEHGKIEKPTKPAYPDPKDFDLSVKSTATWDSPHVVALKRYYAEEAQYKKDLEAYEQQKMIADIQRSTLKLAMKKYRVEKI